MTTVQRTDTEVLLEALARGIARDRIVVDADVLASISHDDAEWAPVGTAAIGLRAHNERDVEHAVAVCAELGVPVVTRGAGTGLTGASNAVDGCLMLDMSKMNRVVEIDVDNLVAVVQPGIVNNDFKAAVAEHGLWYPPDPASAHISSIGGNVSTNAGGLCCLKYGVTRDYVLGARAVLGGDAGYGTSARLGRRTTKGHTGYELAGLMVGAEGTLGVLTELTMRLRPGVKGVPRTIVGAFGKLVDAGTAVALLTRAGLIPSTLELLDRYCLEAVEEWQHLGIEANAEAMLLARVDTPGPAGDDEAKAVADIFETAGALWALQSTDDAEAEALFEARRLAYPAFKRSNACLTEDICVPRSKVPAMLAEIEAIAARHDVKIATIAHIGDGNLHPLIVTPQGEEVVKRRAQAAFEELLDGAIALGGTVAAEHGVGLLKRGGFLREIDPASLATQRAIKRALDPKNLFNPGKIFDA